MKPRIIYKAGFTVTGIALDGDRQPQDREDLWERLGERFREIPQADPDVGYGVVWTRPEDGVSYLAGLSAGPSAAPPRGMVTRRFREGLYAVFHHAGPLSGLPETVDRVFEEWLPQVGVEISGEYYFEVYDDRFEPGKVDSILFLWVPVRRRE